MMNHKEMIRSLRAEIAKLQQVLDLVLEHSSEAEEVRRPGRPKGTGNRAPSVKPEELSPNKRTMSAEGKARIAAAQKKRWAAQKAGSTSRVSPKKATPAKRTSKTIPPKSASKVAPATAKKSAGKRAASAQTKAVTASAKRSLIVSARKNAVKKTVAKKTSQPATKQPVPAGAEGETAA